jgi:hypothetical protein
LVVLGWLLLEACSASAQGNSVSRIERVFVRRIRALFEIETGESKAAAAKSTRKEKKRRV